MRTLMSVIRNYIWPWLKVVTFFPRLILRGIFLFLYNVMLGGNLILSIILMATVFPYCVVALFIAHDTTPYWNGIGFSLATVIWTLLLFAICGKLGEIWARARRAFGASYPPQSD